jgi:hypothetical protein
MDRQSDIEREFDDPAEKHVADEIEKVVRVATSIEEEAMLEAAELEELGYAERDTEDGA